MGDIRIIFNLSKRRWANALLAFIMIPAFSVITLFTCMVYWIEIVYFSYKVFLAKSKKPQVWPYTSQEGPFAPWLVTSCFTSRL